MKPLTVISLGWGVQSWTLAAMAALGDLPPVDYAIHSDTTWERTETYQFAAQWTPWLEARGVKVVTVRDPRAADIIQTAQGSGNVYTHIPAFVAKRGRDNGQLRRQCTQHWKIEPVHRFLKRILAERGQPLRSDRPVGLPADEPTPVLVHQWLGISLDEWTRAKQSRVEWIENRYPLLERRMSRQDCLAWLERAGLPSPGKSACVFCPYHNRRAWEELKRAGGKDWDTAVKVDHAIRQVTGYEGRIFVHPSRVPLDQAVVLPEDHGHEQLDLFGRAEDDELATCDSGHCFV